MKPSSRFRAFEMLRKTLVFLASCIFLLFVSNLAQSMAAKLCPAALSSTLITGTQMASGFLLDVFVFHKVPQNKI